MLCKLGQTELRFSLGWFGLQCIMTLNEIFHKPRQIWKKKRKEPKEWKTDISSCPLGEICRENNKRETENTKYYVDR